MYFDTEDVMHKIGFKGYGDHTHGGLTFFLSLVFGFMTSIFIGGVVDELLAGYPGIQDTIAAVTAYGIIGICIVVSFFAVFWRHWPLIIFFILCTLICIFNIVHMTAMEKDKYYPLVIREKFTPSEERLEEIKALRETRLARIKFDYATKEIPPGALVAVTSVQEGKNVQWKTQYHDIEHTYRYLSAIERLRVDRAVRTIASSDLLANDSSVVKKVSKGQRVTLTGGLSADDSLIEVIHKGDTGWIASSSLFKPALKPPLFPYSTPSLIIVCGIFVLMYFLNFMRALSFWKDYRAEQKVYYTEKRKEFLWLDKYFIKTYEPSADVVSLSFGDVNEHIIKIIPLYGLITIALGFLFNIALQEFGFYGKIEPGLFSGMTFTLLLIAMFIAQIVWNSSISSRPYSNDTECTQCKCPHSTDMIESENFCSKVIETTEVTTTETVTTYSDGSTTRSVDKKTNKYDTYHGSTKEKYYCFNCDTETKEKYKNEWYYPPELGLVTYPKDKVKLEVSAEIGSAYIPSV